METKARFFCSFNIVYTVDHFPTWAVNAEQEAKLERAEMRMVRWMRGVSLREKKTNAELRESMGIEKMMWFYVTHFPFSWG